jgi:sarcosine oxidase, subunit gamma
VTADPVLRHSPLSGYAGRFAEATRASGGTLRLAELPFLTQVNVRLDVKGPAAAAAEEALGVALPPGTGTAATAGGVTALCLGPDEWLAVAAPDEPLEPRLRAALAGHRASVTEVSAQRTTVLVAGPLAAALLAHGCALDLDRRSFTAGQCAQTNLARSQVVLVPRDPAKPGFWVLVRSSFAAYVAEWLLDAATEYLAR